MPAMKATLYVIPGSHPAMAARRMLEHKGIDYKRVDLMPVVSRGVLRALRFPGVTIPSLRLGERRLTGSRQISRALDELRPEPPLFPSDPQERAAVEEAEAWGEQVLADGVRRVLWNAIRRDPAPLRSYAEGARLGIPIGVAVRTAAPIIAAEVRINGAFDERVRDDLAALPGWLDRIDGWIAEGVLGGERPNAADFQIAASLALAMTLDGPAPRDRGTAGGRAGEAARAGLPGRCPARAAAAVLKPLRAPAAA
jgi:glutathione S-transferase